MTGNRSEGTLATLAEIFEAERQAWTDLYVENETLRTDLEYVRAEYRRLAWCHLGPGAHGCPACRDRALALELAFRQRESDPSKCGSSDSAEPLTTESSPQKKPSNKSAAPLHRDGA